MLDGIADAVRVVVGLANVGIIEREGLVERAASIGPRFIDMLRKQLEPLPSVGQVRGIGMMAAVELVDRAQGQGLVERAAHPGDGGRCGCR